MSVSKQQTAIYKTALLSFVSKSEKEIIKSYQKYDEVNAKGIYHQALNEIKEAVSCGHIDNLRKFCRLIPALNSAKNQIHLRLYHESDGNPIKSTNLVILACKCNDVEVLEYIFACKSKILDNLSIDVGLPVILPNDEDEECHNPFYYSIRSGNVELLDTLIKKWPINYFDSHLEELDETLSKAYEELKLKSVLLPDKMEIFVESTLINLRFFSETPKHNKLSLDSIKERIGLVLANIHMLTAEYSGRKEIDEKFLVLAKFIAQTIHVLKRQLKPTYDRFPWEEVEFCLIAYIKSKTIYQEINIIYNTTLTKAKLLKHLQNFAIRLNEIEIKEIDISKKLPNLKREIVIAAIVNNYPPFKELYDDYKTVADVYSLDKISHYIGLALTVDPKEEEGRLIITRVLQVIGEYLKNSLETPKLSSTTSELLLLSAPENTSEILTDLRNSLAHSLSRRTEIEENGDICFFTNIQNDVKKIGGIISNILFKSKIKIFRILLKKFINSVSLDEMKDLVQEFSFIGIGKQTVDSFKTADCEELEGLIKQLKVKVGEKSDYEIAMFNKINNIFASEHSKLSNAQMDYAMCVALLQSFKIQQNNLKIDDNGIRIMKSSAKTTLKNIVLKMKSQNFKDIVEIAIEIAHLARPRLQPEIVNEVDRLILHIFQMAQLEMDTIEWIGKLGEKLNENKFGKFLSNPVPRQLKNSDTVPEDKWNKQLTKKLSTLENILSSNALNIQLIDKYPSFKNNQKLTVVIEMLVQDIMSILGSSKNYLTDNILFLDDNSPLLIGKSLRNHLAHGNTLIDVLLFDPSIAVIANAKKLIAENIIINKKYIGKLVSDDPSRLKDKYDQSLQTVTNQKDMFVALEKGDMEELRKCLKKGADICARSINLWTTLHFAAKGPSLEVLKFIFSRNLFTEDINGRNPLHIAAAYGRKDIVDFFVSEKGLKVDPTNDTRQTPLHVAAQNGHKDVVEILLRNGAKTTNIDLAGFLPVHYAIANNHKDVATFVLAKELNVDIIETMGGYTPLHLAAESGYLEIVNFLLKRKATVNARNDRNWTPLHAASLNGHLEVVKSLISYGANINAKLATDSCTPLHYAVEHGHQEIAEVLLEHGANINVADTVYRNTPFHYAAMDGYVGIVDIFLKNKANVNVTTVDGMTPLHFAAGCGHKEIVDLLIENKYLINAKNAMGCTALHLSSYSGHKDIVELLIKNGAKIHIKDKNNRTALQVAADGGNREVVELLIAKKADINSVDIYGYTALHLSCVNCHMDIVEVLIKNCASINAKDIYSNTALHLVSGISSNDKIAESMLKYSNYTAAGSSAGYNIKIAENLLSNEDDTYAKCKPDVNVGIVKFLLDNGVGVDVRNGDNCTPLHVASLSGNKEVVEALIERKADINARSPHGWTPLHLAVPGNHEKVVEVLINKGAEVNAKDDNNFSALYFAIKYNYKKIVGILIANGADVNTEGGLSLAIFCGFKNIVKILLKNQRINIQTLDKPLHLAAKKGFKDIVQALIEKGADINDDATSISITETSISKAETSNNVTPLYFAAQEGHAEVVEVLLANKAKLNSKSGEGLTPLHIASRFGHNNVVEVLLSNAADVNIRDNKNRTAIELATAHAHLQIVETFMQHKVVDLKAKANDNWTILHIASQAGNLEILKCLTKNGADINAVNTFGSKPIHIAAREGHKDIIEFFLSNGCSTGDLGAANWTLLHYAAAGDQLNMIKYLMEQNVDINAIDGNGSSPIHIAAEGGYENIVNFLVNHGAIYNALDNFKRKPLTLTKNKNIINVLKSTENLFEAVKSDKPLEMEMQAEKGAFINAKNAGNVMPLHFAAWKGYESVVNALLKYQANPNVIGKGGFTPLHYASKFEHLGIVKTLLSNGAIYNVLSNNFKTPLDLAVHKNIVSLLKLVDESFRKVQNGNAKVINDLKRLNDVDTVKAVMNAHNKDNKTLIVAAIHSDFPKIKLLKQILQDDMDAEIIKADILLSQEKYQDALEIFQCVLQKREKLLGVDNPGTLDIQDHVAKILYKQKHYQKALSMFQKIYEKRQETLGLNNKDTLSTKSSIALVLHRLGKNEEALNIYQDLFEKQKEMFGIGDSDTLDTQLHLALVLNSLRKFDEALSINQDLFKKRKREVGANHPLTLCAQNNMAMVLSNQGNSDEAVKIYKDVYEKRKRVLGPSHSDTLRTLHNMTAASSLNKNHEESVKVFQDVLDLQKNKLGPDHHDTLETQYNMANLLFSQGKFVRALKAYRAGFEQRKAILGPNHPSIKETLMKLQIIDLRLKLEGNDSSEILMQNNIFVVANNGDLKRVQDLLEEGADVNSRDAEGRTPLHFAANSEHKDIISLLLKNGANATKSSHKGNSPLHSATSRGNKEIIEMLLQHVKQTNREKFDDFVNAQTTLSGSTSLHIAAKDGCFEIVKCLLKHGVIYNITDKSNKTPLDYSQKQTVADLLNLVNRLFDCAKKGNKEIINKLTEINSDKFQAITNTRNNQGKTLVQVASINNHKAIANALIKLLQAKKST